jgi:hypothetical protein
MRQFRVSGQSLVELAVCLTVVTIAIVGMQLYVRRNLQAKYKQGADYLFSQIREAGGAANAAQLSGAIHQYEPYYAESEFVVAKNAVTDLPWLVLDQNTVRSGWSKVGPPENAQ